MTPEPALLAWQRERGGRRVLLAVAAPKEVHAVLAGLAAAHFEPAAWTLHPVSDRFDLAMTGIGKVNAAAAVARLLDPSRHAAVLSLGIAGTLPAGPAQPADPARIGRVIVATACVYADEGLETSSEFLDCAALGFPLGPFAGSAVPVEPALAAALGTLAAEPGDTLGPIATVSTCSGTDARAATVRARTGASAEAMEGAAIAHAAARLGFPAGEVRVISNTTGNRAAQIWDLPRSLARLRAVAARL